MTLWIEDYFTLVKEIEPMMPEIQQMLATVERIKNDKQLSQAIDTGKKLAAIFNALPKRPS